MNAIEKRYGTVLRIYDNGGKTCDRYTIIPPRWANEYRNSRENGWSGRAENRYAFDGIASSDDPFHAQGFGMRVSGVMPGKHLGKRLHWDALPTDVQRFARQSFPEYAPRNPNAIDFDTIAKHFCIAACWADCEEGTHPRTPAVTLAKARDYAERIVNLFPQLCAHVLLAPGYGSHPDAGSPAAAFGHDLFLTAAGHGVSFADRDELDIAGEELARALHDAWKTLEVSTEFYRGWLYLSFPSEVQP